MEVYESEREQIEAMKKWWQQNGKAVITGLVLGLASLIGWQQWNAYITSARETASYEYSIMMQDLRAGKGDLVRERGLRIMSDYQNTPYAALAALAVAKVAVEGDDIATARAHLQSAIDMATQDEFKQLARLRLARLMIADGQYAQALKTLESAPAGGFKAVYDEAIGDAQAALGNTAQARQAYERAIAALVEAGTDTSILEMKLDDLGITLESAS